MGIVSFLSFFVGMINAEFRCAANVISDFENERYLHLNPILGDLSFIIDQDFLILDPCGFDIRKSFSDANNSCLNCLIKTQASQDAA